jgi:hypothetical protein
MAFSPSLCRSGAELFPGEPREGLALSDELKQLLPFYEPMRREVKPRNRELDVQCKKARNTDGAAADASAQPESRAACNGC